MTDRGDAALAVEAAMTEQEKNLILEKFRHSNLNGAAVADILDILDNGDALLELREPFYEDGAYDQAQEMLGWSNRPRKPVLGMSVLAVALMTGTVPRPEQVVDLAQRVAIKEMEL